MHALGLALIVLTVGFLMHQRSHRRRTAEREAALTAVESSTAAQLAAWDPQERQQASDLLAELRASISAFYLLGRGGEEVREQVYDDLDRVTAAEKRLGRSSKKTARLTSV